MAFPFIVAAGLAVMATAKVVSWVLNSMTEEERQKQELERERTEAIRKRAGAAKARQGSERDKIYRNMAGEHAQGLLRGIREHRVAVADLPAELKKLEQIISTEVADQALAHIANLPCAVNMRVLRMRWCGCRSIRST